MRPAIAAPEPAPAWCRSALGPSILLLAWLGLVLPWLLPCAQTELAGWQRFFAAREPLFPARLSGYEQFLEDLRASTPPGARLALVGERPPVPGERPGTCLHLYPRALAWREVREGFQAAAATADFVALTSARPLRAAEDAEDVLWVRAYPAGPTNPPFHGCLLRGAAPGPIPEAPRATPPKHVAGERPLRTVAGFLGFAIIVTAAGFAVCTAWLRGRLNAMEQCGLALLAGLLVLPAAVVGLMSLGAGLREGFAAVLALTAAAAIWRRRRPGPATPPPAAPLPVPWWVWPPLLLAAGRTVLRGLLPAYSWDTWMIWLLKARVLWLDDGLAGPFWKRLDLFWEAHPAYPLAWPAAGALAGLFTDGPCAYVFAWTWHLVVLGGLLFATGVARRLAGPRAALATGFAGLAFPLLWSSKDVGLADVPLAFALFAAAALLAAARQARDRRLLAASFLFAVTAAALKMEGILTLAAWVAAAACAGFAALPWPLPKPCWHWRCLPLRSPQALLPLGLAALILAWYTVPLRRHFPDDRWRTADAAAAWHANLRRVPAFAGAFAGELLGPRLPTRVPSLPPGIYWHPDEVLLARSAVRFLHLPWLALGTVLLLALRRQPWREWLPAWLFPGMLLALYPLLYLPLPSDLPASIQRLSLHLAVAMGAALLASWSCLRTSAAGPTAGSDRACARGQSPPGSG
jgi:hypothetical protein